MTTKFSSLLTFLFGLGIFLGFLLAGGMVWARLEADFYGFPDYSQRPLPGFTCPRLMTRWEQAEVRLTLRNPGQTPLKQLVAVSLSSPRLLVSEERLVTLAPGEERTLSWPVSAENIDLGRFIFARAYRYPTYLAPMAEATCGILVLNLPFGGRLLFWGWLTAVALCLLPRLFWMEAEMSTRQLLAYRFLAATTVLAICAGYLGSWPLGVFLLVVLLVLMAVVLAQRVLR